MPDYRGPAGPVLVPPPRYSAPGPPPPGGYGPPRGGAVPRHAGGAWAAPAGAPERGSFGPSVDDARSADPADAPQRPRMGARGRIRLAAGILVALGALTGLTLNLLYSMSHVGSYAGQMMTQTYSIGTEYSGTITKQFVQDGQVVHAGDQLVSLKSSVLLDALAKGSVSKKTEAYTINDNNELVLVAIGDGVVTDTHYQEGSFVPANKEIATITKANSSFVGARYHLSPPDYARLDRGAKVDVTLPNNQHLTATVMDFSVESEGSVVATVVKSKLDNPADAAAFPAGTPVDTTLALHGKSFVDWLLDGVDGLLHPKGA